LKTVIIACQRRLIPSTFHSQSCWSGPQSLGAETSTTWISRIRFANFISVDLKHSTRWWGLDKSHRVRKGEMAHSLIPLSYCCCWHPAWRQLIFSKHLDLEIIFMMRFVCLRWYIPQAQHVPVDDGSYAKGFVLAVYKFFSLSLKDQSYSGSNDGRSLSATHRSALYQYHAGALNWVHKRVRRAIGIYCQLHLRLGLSGFVPIGENVGIKLLRSSIFTAHFQCYAIAMAKAHRQKPMSISSESTNALISSGLPVPTRSLFQDAAFLGKTFLISPPRCLH